MRRVGEKLMSDSPFAPGTAVYGYARDSGHADQELSVPQQVVQMRRFVAEHGLTMVHMFKDEARPGSTTVGHEGFEALIASTRHPMREATALLLWPYSRFARDFNERRLSRQTCGGAAGRFTRSRTPFPPAVSRPF